MNYNVNEGTIELPALLYMCHLTLMSMDTFEQFKHSCIVQPGHCGSQCYKSKVTALGGGTGGLSLSQQASRDSQKVSRPSKKDDAGHIPRRFSPPP